MKKYFIFIGITVFFLGITSFVFAQTEIQGSGTGTTHTLITTNATPDTTMVVRDDGNVGIGTVNPTTPLEVNGVIFSSTGGFTFPDGTTQATAAAGSACQHEYKVAKSGGHYTTIAAALTACGTPGPANTYIIRVMPGIYTENVNCLQYVHMQGAGKYTTVIDGTVTGADNCVIEDFYIKQGIICNATSPTILHNIITNTSIDQATGIFISNEGHPWIKENEILDCSGWGIIDRSPTLTK